MPIVAYHDSSTPGTYFWAKVIKGEGILYVSDVKFNPDFSKILVVFGATDGYATFAILKTLDASI
jgi:hypothetical protein